PFILPSSSSTLFPYTTLFRSSESGATRVGVICAGQPNSSNLQSRLSECEPSKPGLSPLALDSTFLAIPRVRASAESLRDRKKGGDRKSTRLNSSHGSSSYAVF